MKKIKLFEEFVTESVSNNIINQVLEALEDDIFNLLLKYESAYIRTFEREMSDYDKELARLEIILDMVRAIEKYTMPTDSLITINSSTSAKGNLEIFAQIQRGSEVYSFNTEVIYAGGHNIQRLHYRYITKTNIPKTDNNRIAAEYADKIKKLSKLEKINNEILQYQARIKKAEETLQINRQKTESEIWDEIKSRKDYYEWPTWQEIVKRGSDKNFEYSEAVFNQEKAKDYTRSLEFWKTMNIKSIENQLVSIKKELLRLNKKIEQAI